MKKGFYLAVSVLSVLACGSAEAQATTDSQKKDYKLVQTPFGLRPAQCVHEHPSGTRIRETANGVETISPQGFAQTFPVLKECLEYDKIWKDQHVKEIRATKKKRDLTDGWLDYAQWFPPKPVVLMSGNYIVPNNPAAGTLPYWLYYFLGTENFQSGVETTILQPVLSWSSLGWTFTAWNCCPQGQVHNAAAVPATANSTVSATMQLNGTTWTIDAQSACQHSTLQVDAISRVFSWTAAALETYYVKDCTYFPTNPLQYTQIMIETSDGVINTPQWNSPTGATMCGGSTNILSPSRVNIQHN